MRRPLAGVRGSAAWRSEAGLADPARHHGSAELSLARGEHTKRADDPAEGQNRRIASAFTQSASTAPLRFFLSLQQLPTKAGADFLELLHLGGVGAEFHPDRLESEAEAAIAELGFQQVHSFTAPAEAAEHANGFVAIAFRQKGAQGRDDRGGCMAAQGG